MTNLLGVLISPVRAFHLLRERGGWVFTFVVLTILSVIIAYIQWPFAERLAEDQLANSQQPLPEGLQEMSVTIGRISAIAGAALAPAITMFFVGLLLMLVNLIVRGEATYMQLSKASLLSSVPSYVGGLLTVILITLTHPENLYDVSITAGALFAEKKGFLFGLATNVLDPFGLWSLILLIIGVSIMTGRSKASVGIWIAAVWLAVRVIGALGF